MSDVRRQLMEGRLDLRRVGSVAAAEGEFPPFVVRDGAGVEIEPVSRYLRDLALSGMSPLTSRSYGYDLLRWFVWALQVDWDQATRGEARDFCRWLQLTTKPVRPHWRSPAGAPRSGSRGTGVGDDQRGDRQAVAWGPV